MASYLLPRPFPYNASKFRFAFRLHLLAVIGLALVAILILQFSPRLLVIAYLVIIAMVILIALTFLTAMPPVQTTHSVDGERVVLRMGLNFRFEIPLAKISKARRVEVGTGRAGIHLDRSNGVLEVIALGPEAVRLRLNDPVVHKGVLVREVVVDVLEPREFIGCIRERKKGAVLIERMDGGNAAGKPVEEEAPAEESQADEGPDEEPDEEPSGAGSTPERSREAVAAGNLKTWDGIRSKLLETPTANPPPIKRPKAPAKPRPPTEPEAEPEEPVAGNKATPPKRDDEDVIELVPALPSASAGSARVVRIPRRKA